MGLGGGEFIRGGERFLGDERYATVDCITGAEVEGAAKGPKVPGKLGLGAYEGMG